MLDQPHTKLSNLFEGKEVRVFEQKGELLFPLADLGTVWGLHRNTLTQIIDRNEKKFDGFHTTCDYVTCAVSLHCVTEKGLYLLMGAVNTDRLKNQTAADAILRFQRWVPELIQKYRKKEIVQVSKEPDYDAILNKIKFVNGLSELTNWNLLELQKEVLREAGMLSLTYHIELEIKALPPAPPKPKDYFTATDIGERIGKSAEEVHLWMYQRKPPLIVRDDVSGWRLTTWGKDYGEERSVDLTGGTVVWRIKWKKDVLRLFNIPDGVHEEMG